MWTCGLSCETPAAFTEELVSTLLGGVHGVLGCSVQGFSGSGFFFFEGSGLWVLWCLEFWVSNKSKEKHEKKEIQNVWFKPTPFWLQGGGSTISLEVSRAL